MSLPYNVISDILYQTGPGAIHIRNFTLNQSYLIKPYLRSYPLYNLVMTARVTTEVISDTETIQLPSPSWILSPCDYVDDGFFIQTIETLRYLAIDTPNSYINSLPEKYTENYNSAIWIITGVPGGGRAPVPGDTSVPVVMDWTLAQPLETTDLGREIGLMVFDTVVGTLIPVPMALSIVGEFVDIPGLAQLEQPSLVLGI
jgi:hypothetical protein